jgi:hypothetical protein
MKTLNYEGNKEALLKNIEKRKNLNSPNILQFEDFLDD